MAPSTSATTEVSAKSRHHRRYMYGELRSRPQEPANRQMSAASSRMGARNDTVRSLTVGVVYPFRSSSNCDGLLRFGDPACFACLAGACFHTREWMQHTIASRSAWCSRATYG
jgi:hypothetical protein